VPFLAATAIRLLGMTLRFEDACDPGVTPGYLLPPPGVFAFWHRSLLMAAYRFRDMGIAILISQSFDGELIARTVECLGFLAVRGSSSRGGAAGLIAIERACRGDASTGPRLAAFTARRPTRPHLRRQARRHSPLPARQRRRRSLPPRTGKSMDAQLMGPFLHPQTIYPRSHRLARTRRSSTFNHDFEAQHAQVQATLDRAVMLAEERYPQHSIRSSQCSSPTSASTFPKNSSHSNHPQRRDAARMMVCRSLHRSLPRQHLP